MVARHKKAAVSACLMTLLYCSCITYDKAVVYKKNYQQGKNNELRFDGFYKEISPAQSLPPEQLSAATFFYSDGSIMQSGLFKDTVQLKSMIAGKGIWGIWGNYQISGDTITIETFSPNGGSWNHDRYLTRGVIQSNRIEYFESIDRMNKSVPSIHTIYFVSLSMKPDSTGNWTRKKRKYNR
jgi:hypothetical protein